MQFILKEANLETNARLTIGEALVANGQWEQLSPEQKELIVMASLQYKLSWIAKR